MAADTRRQAVLLGILVVLILVLVWSRSRPDPGAALSTARPPAPAQTPGGDVPSVRLEALARERVAPADTGRNPFRRQARPARNGSSGSADARPVPTPPPAPVVPAGPPPPPPITLKFIGFVNQSDRAGRLAVLSDGRGVYYGRQGDVIEGRYRIVRIGEESIELEYLDGRGRQTVRLTGEGGKPGSGGAT
jgi:hypothetical protein